MQIMMTTLGPIEVIFYTINTVGFTLIKLDIKYSREGTLDSNFYFLLEHIRSRSWVVAEQKSG